MPKHANISQTFTSIVPIYYLLFHPYLICWPPIFSHLLSCVPPLPFLFVLSTYNSYISLLSACTILSKRCDLSHFASSPSSYVFCLTGGPWNEIRCLEDETWVRLRVNSKPLLLVAARSALVFFVQINFSRLNRPIWIFHPIWRTVEQGCILRGFASLPPDLPLYHFQFSYPLNRYFAGYGSRAI
jgi:hypothetical protein